MTVNAIPERVLSSEIPNGYTCPVDLVSRSSEENLEWVQCPLVSAKFISLGSCIDLQDLARSDGFYSDPYLDMFEAIARRNKIPIENVRRECLLHQVDVLRRMVVELNEDGEKVRLTLFQVSNELNKLE